MVSEIVFCFDGDRAGRAAAWRALQNALPEATAGRELKFLFLPDKEDPDSLVGKEGRETFEARYAAALPLSEYLVSHLLEDIDITHADGKARFVAEARPLFERVPAGPYRELLLDRLAQAIGVSAERFLHHRRSDRRPAQVVPGRKLLKTGRGCRGNKAGRRSAPGAAAWCARRCRPCCCFPAVPRDFRLQIARPCDAVDEPGADVLRELLDNLNVQPATSTAQVLERWRDHPLGNDWPGWRSVNPSSLTSGRPAMNCSRQCKSWHRPPPAPNWMPCWPRSRNPAWMARSDERLLALLKRG